jgi:hypothetical protein
LNNGLAPATGIKLPISFHKISKSLLEIQKNYGVNSCIMVLLRRPVSVAVISEYPEDYLPPSSISGGTGRSHQAVVAVVSH